MEVHPTTARTQGDTDQSELKYLIFEKVQELMQRFSVGAFLLISEDVLPSEYIGSSDLLIKFETCGLKAKPYDINRTHTHPCCEMTSSLETETTKDSEEVRHDRDENDLEVPGAESEKAIDGVRMAAKRLEEVCNSLKYVRGNDGQDSSHDDEVGETGSEQDAEYDSFVCSKYADAGEDIDDVDGINANKTADTQYGDDENYDEYLLDVGDGEDADGQTGEKQTISKDALSYNTDDTQNERNQPSESTNRNDRLLLQKPTGGGEKKNRPAFAKGAGKRKYRRCTQEEKDLKPEKIRKLMEERRNERQLMCQKCGKGFAIKSSWKIHESNDACSLRKCQYCPAAPMMYEDWMTHTIANHATSMAIFCCELCGKEFLHDTLRKKHLHRMHGKEWECFKCNICGKVYQDRSALKYHKIQHHEKRNYDCCFCDRKFATEKLLLKHQNQHTEGKKYECELCGGFFVSSTSLGVHMHNKHTKKDHFTCQYCEKSFCVKNDFELHLSSVHDHFEKFIPCDYCDKVFKHKLRLKAHIRSIHTSDQVQCEVCGKQFRNREKLRAHMFVHSDVKQHSCDLCDKKFKQKIALQRHKSVHSDVRPYQCEKCGYACKLKGNLGKHMRTHKVK